MSRPLIIAVAMLIGSSVFASEREVQTTPTSNRYRTIPLVIRVAEDLDEYIDTSAEPVPAFHDEQAAFQGLSPLDDLASFELSSENWLSPYDLEQFDFATLDLPSYIADGRSKISIHIDELIGLPTDGDGLDGPFETRSTSLFAEQTRLGSSPSGWLAGDMKPFVDLEKSIGKPTDLAAQIIVATPKRSQSSRAVTAGTWLFATLMIAPIAWLAWTEYNDLVSRSRSRVAFGNERETPSEPCETRRQMEERKRQRRNQEAAEGLAAVQEPEAEEESVQFTEIAAEMELVDEVSQDDCEFEVGVLEDANALLATVSPIRTDAPDPEPNQGLAAELTAALADETDAAEVTDELTSIRGIGPATRDFLVDQGICNVQDLLEADVEGIREILHSGGTRFQAAQPKNWVEQASEMLSTTHS